MTIDMEQFKATYVEESLEGLDSMETHLLNLQPGSTDEDVINTIFRAAHSIKGGGGTFGFTDISAFTHVVETLLDQIRNGEREITQQAIGLFLSSVDVIREMLAAAQHDEPVNEQRANEVQQALEALLGSSKETAVEEIASPAKHSSQSGWQICFKPFPEMLSTGNDVVRMFRELDELAELNATCNLDKLPALEHMNPEESHLDWNLTLTGDISRQQIDEVFVWVEDECELEINPLPSKADKIPEVAAAPMPAPSKASVEKSQPGDEPALSGERRKPARSSGAESSSIRVDIDKIDALINMVGELVITQSMLSQLGEDFQVERLEKLQDGLSQLERNTRELQESVMRIRMIPISFAFNRFPRMIHDMCNKFGKKVELKVSGESTELDKTVMEKIGDPLVHLVRNSMDHGIEMPELRLAAGKPETGTVHLNAFHQGGNIVIEISDDGAGLNRQKIHRKAVERGLVEDGVELSEAKIFDLLFEPGFSTADKVTDVSGRGVGMDVVRRNIQALGGSVDVASQEGKGSRFTIRLPLTLAILDGQLVRVGDQTYIIPLVSIVESLQVQKKSVNAIAGKAELYKLRDEYIPIIRSYETFNIEPDTKELDKGLLVVVEGDGKKAGLLVDDLLAQQQVVIKSLESNFRKVDGLSGATILGDGRVALIVDIAGLIRIAQNREPVAQFQAIQNSGVAA